MVIKYNALTDPVDTLKLRAFSQEPQVTKRAIKYYGLFAALLLGGFSSAFIVPFFSVAVVAPGLNSTIVFVITALGIVGMAALGYFIGKIISRHTLEHMYRLTNFAKINGWFYKERFNDPSHAGMIFGNGHSRYALDQIYSTSGSLFEIGNYYYTTGSGKNSQRHNWGYVCIKLKRRVPNMVLDSKANNSKILGFNMSNLPESLRGNATMLLEGDFNNYFTLYAPKEYERDALYVFTPELMALLVDESAKFDVEVVDDRMYVYSSVPFDMTKVATLQAIFKIINQVGEEMIDNTDYYADERVGDRQSNIVAAQGARLKHSVPVFVIVVTIIILLFQILPLFFGH